MSEDTPGNDGSSGHEKIKPKDIFEMYRFRISNENELIHYRMTWFLPFQSFLFISVAIFSNGNLVEELGTVFLLGAAMVGIGSSVVTFVSIHSAVDTMNRLEYEWYELRGFEEFKAVTPSLMGATKRENAGKSGKKPTLRSLGTWISFGMPGVTFAFWIGVFVTAILIWYNRIVISSVQ
ncbi:MAG: hypothetical protein AAF689_16555 [Pseudomonadota bacterium]